MRVFCNAYRLEDRSELLDTIERRQRALHDSIAQWAAAGEPAFVAMLRNGHAAGIVRDTAYLPPPAQHVRGRNFLNGHREKKTMLVDLRTMLSAAQAGGYAVGAFNVYNLEGVRAVIGAAEATRSPAIARSPSQRAELWRSGARRALPGRRAEKPACRMERLATGTSGPAFSSPPPASGASSKIWFGFLVDATWTTRRSESSAIPDGCGGATLNSGRARAVRRRRGTPGGSRTPWTRAAPLPARRGSPEPPPYSVFEQRRSDRTSVRPVGHGPCSGARHAASCAAQRSARFIRRATVARAGERTRRGTSGPLRPAPSLTSLRIWPWRGSEPRATGSSHP